MYYGKLLLASNQRTTGTFILHSSYLWADLTSNCEVQSHEQPEEKQNH